MPVPFHFLSMPSPPPQLLCMCFMLISACFHCFQVALLVLQLYSNSIPLPFISSPCSCSFFFLNHLFSLSSPCLLLSTPVSFYFRSFPFSSRFYLLFTVLLLCVFKVFKFGNFRSNILRSFSFLSRVSFHLLLILFSFHSIFYCRLFPVLFLFNSYPFFQFP